MPGANVGGDAAEGAVFSPIASLTLTLPPGLQGLAIGNGLTDPAIQYGAYR